jgi:hypothetical protein
VTRVKVFTTAAAVLLLFFPAGCSLFFPGYTLTVIVEDESGGSVTVSPEREAYPENTIVGLSAEADAGWVFKSWQGVSSAQDNKAEVLLDMHRTVTVQFGPELKSSNPADNFINPPSAEFSPSPDNRWTFMVYLDADNNLDAYAAADLNEMELGLLNSGNSENLNIIVLYDRSDSAGETLSGTRIYEVAPDADKNSVTSIPLYPDSGAGSVAMTEGLHYELNMGDPAVLRDFMIYCRQNYQAEHYSLVLWNHGGGSRSITPEPEIASRLLCVDENTGSGSGSDYLFTDELQQALKDAVDSGAFTSGIDLVGADACVMGTVEAAYELRDLTQYYAASMAPVHSGGWDYSDLFGRMKPGTGSSDPESLARLIVDSFRNTAPLSPPPAFSAVRTSTLNDLKTAIDLLAAQLYKTGKQSVIESIRDASVNFYDENYEAEVIAQPYLDINDFCNLIINNRPLLDDSTVQAAEGVLTELSRTVISAYAGAGPGNYYGTGAEVKRGLSIFFSKGSIIYNNLPHYAYQYWYTDRDCSSIGPYGFIDFCTSDEDGVVESWREMHEAWYDPYLPEGYTPGSW